MEEDIQKLKQLSDMADKSKNLVESLKSLATDNNWRKCKHCGKFISYKQMEEQKDVMFHFIPDSEITTEEAYWVHRHCW